jgi:dihydroflavonol-4-reductase
MPETTKRVLVTGGSGYIAGYLIRQLLAEGWQVHSTLRSLGKEAAVRALLAVGDAPLRFFEADLNSDAGWAEAAGGCTHMAHVASPLPTGVPKDANELIVPAREGALRALRAAKAAGIAKVVMTSSVAAVAYGRGRGEHHFTEADWTDGEDLRLSPYIRSKALAERAARDWIAREGAGIEFCSINPSVVLGPVWGRDYSASVTIVRSLLNGRMAALADIGFGIVDVRDVADLHVRALQTSGLQDERFIASGRFMKLLDIAQVLKAGLGGDARRVATRVLPDALVRVVAWFSPVARATLGELGSVRHQDSGHALRRLGWKTRPEDQSILDCAHSLLKLGIVKP